MTRGPIRSSELLERVRDPAHGAALLFLGTVRNHDQGRPVDGLRYEAYEEMARRILVRIAAEAEELLEGGRVAVVHRVGELAVGDVSVAIAVAGAHRDPAYRASRHVIEQIKERLPVWKKELYTDGDEAWVQGRTPGSGAGDGGGDP